MAFRNLEVTSDSGILASDSPHPSHPDHLAVLERTVQLGGIALGTTQMVVVAVVVVAAFPLVVEGAIPALLLEGQDFQYLEQYLALEP